MKKFVLSVAAAMMLAAPAFAADMPVKAKKVVVAPNPWEIAIGAAVVSDYNFRGISQSNRQPSFWAYVEPRYNIAPNLQVYAGVAYETIRFPNNARSEVDFYAGVRPTLGPVAFDFGLWYYYYPGGTTFNGLGAATTCTNGFFSLGACNVMKSDVSFLEIYGKATYNVTDAIALGLNVFYDPNWLNTGAAGTYVSGTAKYTLPSTMFPADWGAYVSAELGHYWLGTTDAFYAVPAFPAGVNLPDYTTWNLGVGFTYKILTLDLRYYDTDLSRGKCNVLTGDHTATFNAGAVSTINPSGLTSRWCGPAFIAKLAVDYVIK
ncbi:MAG: hypothetical protein JOZ70_15185 [Pseudolabrys sp.]|nr:hypothetical protein [Pseudolabrys sp.]MBV9956581.1 hypothetical protein [Pseudolabrys sp.]